MTRYGSVMEIREKSRPGGGRTHAWTHARRPAVASASEEDVRGSPGIRSRVGSGERWAPALEALRAVGGCARLVPRPGCSSPLQTCALAICRFQLKRRKMFL